VGVLRLVAALIVAAALGGCAASPHRQQAFNPAERTAIRTIGVLTPALSDEVAVRLFVHPVESLGVIGMLIAAGDMSGKTHEFTSALNARGFICQSQFREDLLQGLRAAGYEVRVVPTDRPRDEYGFATRYPDGDKSIDAYLDLYSGLIGYTAAGISTPYRPTVYLGARLVRATDHRVLYQDAIAYNAFGDPRDMVTIAPTSDYDFQAFNDLMARQDRAVEGLRVALKATGNELARQLR
jgi:hypothetical protein